MPKSLIIPKWPRPSKRDTLRALQCCYYVFHQPLLTDPEFDHLQKEWEAETGKRLPIGSDNKKDYTEPEYALALYFGFRQRFKDAGEKPKPIAEVTPPTTGGGNLYGANKKKASKTSHSEQQTGFQLR